MRDQGSVLILSMRTRAYSEMLGCFTSSVFFLVPRGCTRTGKALWDVLNFLPRGRTKKKRVLAVIADCTSQDHVLKAAGALKRANVETSAIGVGRGYTITQLHQMATDRSHVFTVDFRNLNSVKKKTCRGRVCWIYT